MRFRRLSLLNRRTPRRFAVAAVVATALVVTQTARPALADFDSDLPQLSTPAVQPIGGGYVFARGLDGSLLYSEASGPFVSLGGQIVGDPGAALSDTGLVAVARGTDNQIYSYRRPVNGSGWVVQALPGLVASGDPTAVSLTDVNGPGIQVVARGQDGTVSVNAFAGGVWSGWSSLGGFVVTSTITARAAQGLFPQFIVQLFARGADGRVFGTSYVASSTGGPGPINWGALGALAVTSNIALASPGGLGVNGGPRVIARGTDNAAWVYDLNVGGPWQSLGGPITSDPTANGDSTGTLRVFARGLDNAVYVNAFAGAGWSGWQSLGGTITSNPVASAGFNLYLSRVAARGLDNALYVNTLPLGSSTWSGYVRVAGQLA